MFNDDEGATCKHDGTRDIRQTAARHQKVCLGLRQWHSLPKCKRSVGTGQHRAVIQSIPNDCHLVPLLLALSQKIQFILGRALALERHNANFTGHTPRRITGIARQQMNRDATLLQCSHRTSSIRANIFL